MGYSGDPNLGRTIVGHMYQIIGREKTAEAADSMWGKIYKNAQAEVNGGRRRTRDLRADKDLNVAYMQVRAELAKMDGNREEANRLEGWARSIERGR